MATKQALRGDGSKEYQIITNLSRGINNSVADDVLIDNAFRDVVNFSSDQLGNISKRDNLINSNFKEFIRKLAYGDFNLDTFNIIDYNSTEGYSSNLYNYKRYSYGRIDQIILQNFYEMLFTNKHYIGDPLFATYSGVSYDNDGHYYKVPSYSGAAFLKTEEAEDLDYGDDIGVDTTIQDDTDKLSGFYYELKSNNYQNPYKRELYCVDENGKPLTILNTSVPEGWTLSEDATLISKIFSDAYFENVSFIIIKGEEQATVQTSVCDKYYENPSDPDKFFVTGTVIEKDDYYDIYIFLSNVSTHIVLSSIGLDGDYGWTLTEEELRTEEQTLIYPKGALYKRFNKSDLDPIYKVNFTIYSNNFSKESSLSHFTSGLNVKEGARHRYNDYTFDLYNAKLKNVYVVEQNNFFKNLQNIDKLFKEGDFSTNNSLDNTCSFDAYFILYGDVNTSKEVGYQEDILGGGTPANLSQWIIGDDTPYHYNCLLIYRLTVDITSSYDLTLTITCKTVGDDDIPNTVGNTEDSKDVLISNAYIANYKDEDILNGLFLNKYSNSLYLATGYSSIIQLSLVEDDIADYITSIGSNNDFEVSGTTIKSTQANIYLPVPYEITNPGFNLIAADPLTAIDEAGSVGKIRGVFYTVNDNEVVQNVPCNIPFQIHVIVTGSGTLNVPQIRPNNGELDEEKNAYSSLSGSWSGTVFNCTGIDSIEAYEMKITRGDDKYLTYFTPTPYVPKETGSISELKSLVLGCPRSRVINNQLVLFGNGGYLFFSDFENFRYFPSYYYVYVANGTDEEVVDIVYFRQFYAIFTNKRILRMSGDFATDNFEIGPLNDFMGCVNHNTIRQVYNSLYFIGYNGIYALNQGYLGAGTENLKRIDTQLTNTFNFDNVAYCYVMGNVYIIILKDGKTWYTYDVDNDMFLRYDYSLGDSVTLSSINFIETLEENQIYALLATVKNERTYTDELLLYNFPLAKDVNYSYKDSGEGYISSFETPYINLGTPTNTKKFKNLFIKMFNETDSLIPLYLTIYVDDILAISPEDYVIELDEETNTYYYYFKVENNGELLRAHNLLGTLTLGEDTLGDNIIQQLKFTINAKGRAIKIILADGYDYPNKDKSAIIKYRNDKKFSISTLGIVYKLKKVKEG